MSQRNPQNDRYMGEKPVGKTRKSAAKAKPKAKAAASVRVQRVEPSKEDKKQRKKAEKAKANEFKRESYHPPTPEYKRMRKIWFGAIGVGVVMLLGSIVIQMKFPDYGTASIVAMILAYVFVIGAFIFDGLKLNKLRKEYRLQLAMDKSKENREREKQKKAAEREEKKTAEAEDLKPKEPEQPTGVVAGLFKKATGQLGVGGKSSEKDSADVASEADKGEAAENKDAVDKKAQ